MYQGVAFRAEQVHPKIGNGPALYVRNSFFWIYWKSGEGESALPRRARSLSE